MTPREKIVLVLVTAPSMKAGRTIAHAALQTKLVACVNIIPQIESHYWWQGKIESAREVLLLLKTTNAKLAALERLILSKHPYQTPEFIALQISTINKNYAHWLVESVTGPARPQHG